MRWRIIIALLLILGIGLAAVHYMTPSSTGNWVKANISIVATNEDALRYRLNEVGVEDAMSELIEESGDGSRFDCHQQAHNIGRIGYELFKEKSFQQCDSSCHAGCYHGAMEWFLVDKGTDNLAKDIDSICKTFVTPFERFECLHGVGHGLLAYTDYNMTEAIDLCRQLSTPFAVRSCYGGMFMENVIVGQGYGATKAFGGQSHSTEWLKNDDPVFPCNSVDQSDYPLVYECYQMQTSWILTVYPWDFKKTAEICTTVRGDMIPVCFRSLGRDAAGWSLRNPQKTVEYCENAHFNEEYYSQCILGAVGVYIDFSGPKLENQATELCKAIQDPDGKSVCYEHLVSRLPEIFNTQEPKVKICSSFEEAFKYYCRRAGIAAYAPTLAHITVTSKIVPPLLPQCQVVSELG